MSGIVPASGDVETLAGTPIGVASAQHVEETMMSVRLPYLFDPDDPSPDWSHGPRVKVHFWMNHVRGRTRGIWASLTPDQRVAVALDADEAAGDERWE
jgi:hypothetical protein